MRKFLFLLALTMSCERVTNIRWGQITRCENDEVVCYIAPVKGGMFCKFKGEDLYKRF